MVTNFKAKSKLIFTLLLISCVCLHLIFNAKAIDFFRHRHQSEKEYSLHQTSKSQSNGHIRQTTPVPATITCDGDAELCYVEREMAKRRKNLANACSALGYKGKAARSTKFFFSERYRFAYCSVPKTGCTNFKKILWLLEGRVKNITEISRYADSSHFHEETNKLLNVRKWRHGLPEFAHNFTKLLVVRHPFERLVSAYHNKLVPLYKSKPPQFGQLAERIRQEFGATPQRKEAKGEIPTFEEFVDFVTEESLAGRSLDEHFRSMEAICSPCSIPYDTIAHLETLHSDVKYLLKKIEAPDDYFQLESGYSRGGSRQVTSEKAIQHFSDLSLQKVRRLYEAISDDFLLFGYDVQPYLKRT